MAQEPAIRVGEGVSIPYTPSGSAVTAGEVVVQGVLAGVAARPIADGDLGTLDIEGLFDFPKITGAINAGTAVYWDASGDPVGGTAGTGAATATVGSNTFLGNAIEDAASGDATVRVRLTNLVGQTVHGSTTTPIADPGDAGAIPVATSGYVPLVTAGAETRTLAAPASIGLQLLLYMKTDGGDCVVACATTVNETGNNRLTFDNTGEAILLVAVEEGANLRWRSMGADGVGLTTV